MRPRTRAPSRALTGSARSDERQPPISTRQGYAYHPLRPWAEEKAQKAEERQVVRRCIWTAVSGWYEAYEPLFRFCANRAYPDVQVFVEVLHNARSQFFAACARLLQAVQGYDRVYVCDVDLMHVPLQPDLWEYHELRMQATGLPFSNSPRGKEPHGKDRLTGLHMATPEWYEKTKDARAHEIHRLFAGEIGNGRFDDELALMRVCRASGFPVPPKEPLVPRHFAVHLGTLRAYQTHNRPARETALRRRITPEMATKWNETIDSEGFPEAAQESCRGCPQIAEQLERLELYTRKLSPVKTDRYYLKYKAG